MAANEQLTVTLPADMADLVHRKVASGEYATESEVIADSLTLLENDEEAFERWLLEVAVPACDAIHADPSRAIPLQELEAKLIARRRELNPAG
jgi:putative addiction module CopG family antidote